MDCLNYLLGRFHHHAVNLMLHQGSWLHIRACQISLEPGDLFTSSLLLCLLVSSLAAIILKGHCIDTDIEYSYGHADVCPQMAQQVQSYYSRVIDICKTHVFPFISVHTPVIHTSWTLLLTFLEGPAHHCLGGHPVGKGYWTQDPVQQGSA